MPIIVENFAEKREQLERLLATDSRFAEDVRQVVKEALRALRKTMQDKASDAIGDDPRQAYRAVKMAVYRQIIGGNVSLLNRKSAGSSGNYAPVRTLQPGQWGGNRRTRSERTNRIDGYMGADRGFILRFLNSGAGWKKERMTKYGDRGEITARGFFNSAQSEMEKTAETIANLIDDIIEDRLT